jgi:hypothetical protein
LGVACNCYFCKGVSCKTRHVLCYCFLI